MCFGFLIQPVDDLRRFGLELGHGRILGVEDAQRVLKQTLLVLFGQLGALGAEIGDERVLIIGA